MDFQSPLGGSNGLLGFVLLFGISLAAVAEHEADHRYTVSGYVLNEDGSPIASDSVLISANGVGARGETDADGYYSLRLHLHNADLGRTLRFKTDYGDGVVRASFDPNDRSSPRVHHANFVGGRLIEGQLDNARRIPTWVYFLFGSCLLIIAATLLGRPIKRLRKRLHPTPQGVQKNKPDFSKTRSKTKKRKRR